jgi:phosphoribosylformimino-5-aminoimidazole carboxamide ribotide isomerase
MEIFPAIDLSGGRVVRLTKGDYQQMTVYDTDPVEAALGFQRTGAKYLHVVDLDGAKDGTTANFEAISRIVQATELFVEVGGGIRDEERIKKYLSLGVGRVILGTVAVKNFPFVQEMAAKYGDKIVVGVDARGGKVAISGWLEETELETADFCRKCHAAGVQTVIVTDIEKDGTLGGTNLELYRELVQIPGLQVVASGGVSFPEEIDALAEIGVAGIIIGKALYSGTLDLADCLMRAKGETK